MRLGLVLAGGLGRRFGRTKGDLAWNGQTLAERAARTLEPLCDAVRVSIGPETRHPAPAWGALVDGPPAGRGPLAGLEAAFHVTPTPRELLVLACDYPRVDRALLGLLIEQATAGDDVICFIDRTGRMHPLVALWRSRAAPVIAAALTRGQYAVHAVLDRLCVRRIEPGATGEPVDERLRNVNAPADWPI